MALPVSAYFTHQFYTHDVGQIAYMFHSTWHGNFFYSIAHEAPHFSKHFTPTLLLFLPIHMAARQIVTQPIIDTAVLVSGAWAVAWMCGGVMRRGRRIGAMFTPLGLALGIFWLCNPFVGSMVLAYHFESTVVGLLLWALAALVNGRRCVSFGCRFRSGACCRCWRLWWCCRVSPRLT